MKKLLVFDLDGTLIESTSVLVDAFNESFNQNNLPKVSKKELKFMMGNPAEDIVKKFYPEVTPRKLAKIISDKQNNIDSDRIKLKNNAIEALILLKVRYDLAIVSNAKHSEVIKILRSLKVNPRLFKAIVAADDVSNPKPNPESLKKLSEVFEQEIVAYVGDTEIDVQTAKSFGTKSVILIGTRTHENIINEKPDIIINDLAELSELI